MSDTSRNRPSKDVRDQLRDGQALAEAVRRNELDRAKQIAADLQRREADRLNRVSQNRPR
jgi:hypothetical protein